MINGKYFRFNIFEWHHLYTGAILALVGYTYFDTETVAFHILWILGWAMIIDDIGQHILQGWGNFGPKYHSFFHYIGKPLYWLRQYLTKKYSWLNWLNRL